MKYLYTRTAWADAILMILILFIGGASVAGTWICSDLHGNEVYTDHNGPRCRESQPTNPYDIVKKPSAKTPQAPKHRPEPAPIPFSPLVRPFGERKSGAIAEVDHKAARYSEQDLLRAVASGNKAKIELMLATPTTFFSQGRVCVIPALKVLARE